MDKLTPEQRHKNMSRIRSTETSPERQIRSALFRMGFRFRKNDRRLAGTPDMVLPRYHAVIFVNGCFWHGHRRCRKYVVPKTNTQFWVDKIARNRERDEKQIQQLISEGWRVGIVWECSISGKRRDIKLLNVSESICLWLEDEPAEMRREF
ncbi:MAG: DNA mismatch endonuclease Vsr [Treponemataceae bacterium]|nr:DNA mismatch endonuclease Vsr [Treponemataceae bacterium]